MTIWDLIGWSANACYFSRFLWQWLASEKAGKVVAPTGFWWLSLIGVIFLGIYSMHREEPVLLAGTIVNGLIYARNVAMAHGRVRAYLNPWTSSIAAVIAASIVILTVLRKTSDGEVEPTLWLAVVVVGQTIWSSRFVLQWWWAERARRAGFPVAFWWLSLAGNSLLLAYALHLADPVYIAGLGLGPFVQARNLMLAYRKAPAEAPVG